MHLVWHLNGNHIQFALNDDDDDIDNDYEVNGNDDEVENNDINNLVLHLYNLA